MKFDSPEIINENPYGDGWMIKIKVSDTKDLDSLLNSDQYERLLNGE